MKSVLVTGGGGYVGAVLVPKLVKKGYDVTVLDLFLYANPFDGEKKMRDIKIIKGDIRNANVVATALKGVESVIHLACISNDPSYELDPKLGKSINYDATTRLIDAAKKAGVKRFIYASSSSVYGIKEEERVTEDLPLKPLTDYSKYKALCEKYLLEQASNEFTAVVLRPATVCGWSPRLRLDLTVNLLTIQALTKKKITVFGGDQKRPNIHIEDMVELYIRMLEYPKEKIAGKVYNAGYQNLTLAQIADMIKRKLGDPTIQVVTVPTSDLRSYHISSEKMRRELGFTPNHTVEEAIKDIARHYYRGDVPHPESAQYSNVRSIKVQLARLL